MSVQYDWKLFGFVCFKIQFKIENPEMANIFSISLKSSFHTNTSVHI